MLNKNGDGVNYISAYWGKADRNDAGEPTWHPLVWHCLDVAAVGQVWLELSPALCAAFRTAFSPSASDNTPILDWLPFFVATHDLGKFDIRFQLKAPDTLAACWPDFDFDEADASQAKGYDHGKCGLAWGFSECTAWAEASVYDYADAWKPWLQAVTGHHGEWAQPIPEATWPEAADNLIEHDRLARREFVQSLAELFLTHQGLSLADLPPPCSTAAQHLLAGFCSVCDWIGSNTEVSPYAALAPDAMLKNYLDARIRDISAQGWLKRFGLLRQAQPYAGLEALLHAGDAPRGVQTRVQDLPLQPGLTLIEAPTGSGKTEAALAHAWRLLAAGRADSIVFALPTQATANAMLQRAEAFAECVFALAGASLVLAHGKSRFNDEFQHLLAGSRTHTAQGSQEAGAQCTAWLAQSRKRVFLGQIGVCTVDQVLLSVLPVRHKFVRGFGINKSVLIVDEVHAYDAYMYGLLEEVLRRQRASGGSAILLSATLPSTARNALLAAWGAASETVTDYPALWWVPTRQEAVTPSMLTPITVAKAHEPPNRTVAIERLRLPDALPDEELFARITAAAESGARVAVILNLVDAAQATVRRFRELTCLPVDIFHARYRFLDRRGKEAAVLSHYGREAVRDGGRILVATQVVEQSLDLDFDWMVTQICPVDLLFQRLGRLHRHEWRQNRPPEFTAPACTVMTVEDDDYGVFELIYGNARVLWRSDRLLETCQEITFPTAYRQWIEAVYGEDFSPEEPAAVTRDYDDWQGKQYAAHQEARQMITTPRLGAFDEAAIAIKTRDGEMSLHVLPLQDDGRLLDGVELATLDEREQAETLSLNLVPVPASWRNFLRDSGLTMDESGHFPLRLKAQGQAHVVSLKDRRILRYTSEFGLERLDSPTGDPAGEGPTRMGN